jgi:hypothetical protein
VVDFVEGTNQETKNLFSPKDDLLLALSLAFVASSEPSSSRENRLARAYLSSLPDSSSYLDTLPWRWTDDDLTSRLQGSPLFERVQKTRTGIKNDFQLITRAFLSLQGNTDKFPVTFDKFSDMLAVVSSRAFVIEEPTSANLSKLSEVQQRVALIPVLDLCDHCRGGSLANATAQTKNLSYTFHGGSMVVNLFPGKPHATSLPTGETLRLTYGAKGNAQLLLNYGFTIPNNLEPDGSSNDVLEFFVPNVNNHNEGTVVPWRTGDKSYTFECFTKALACFGSEQQRPLGTKQAHDQDDMEAFLNDDDDEDDGVDLYEGEAYGELNSEMEASKCDGSEVDATVKGLAALCEAIHVVLGRYQPDSIVEKRIDESTPRSTDFSVLLIQSEKRTLKFYLLAARKIMARLQEDPVPIACSKNFTNKEDRDLVESQTSSLADAFLSIRCSDAFPGKFVL